MAIQERNSELVSLLSPDFIRKTDTVYLHGLVTGVFLSLPGLVALWPMTISVDDVNTLYADAFHIKSLPSVRGILEFADSAAGYGELAFMDNASGNLKWGVGVFADSATPSNSFYVYQYKDASEAVSNMYRFVITNLGNFSFGGQGSFGGGVGVMFVKNATTIPATNPSGGGIIYTDAGYLMYRGPSGTLTQLAIP